MSEGDWWLCERCHSLNNLAARKCYNCRSRKQRKAVRASEILGYRVTVSWDGKVQMEPNAQADGSPVAHSSRDHGSGRDRTAFLPIREPPKRSILSVAPRPPHGARAIHLVGDTPGYEHVVASRPMLAVPIGPDPSPGTFASRSLYARPDQPRPPTVLDRLDGPAPQHAPPNGEDRVIREVSPVSRSRPSGSDRVVPEWPAVDLDRRGPSPGRRDLGV